MLLRYFSHNYLLNQLNIRAVNITEAKKCVRVKNKLPCNYYWLLGYGKGILPYKICPDY